MLEIKKYNKLEAEQEIERIIEEYAEKLKYAESDEKRSICEARDKEIYCVEINTVN